MIRANWDENLQQARSYLGRTISSQTLELIGSWAMKRLQQDEMLFRSRVADGFIRECDGEPAQWRTSAWMERYIFLTVLEFNEKFRFTDTACRRGIYGHGS